MYWLFGILFSLDVYLDQHSCSREGLELSRAKGALPSLRIGGVGWEALWREWKERREKKVLSGCKIN